MVKAKSRQYYPGNTKFVNPGGNCDTENISDHDLLAERHLMVQKQ